MKLSHVSFENYKQKLPLNSWQSSPLRGKGPEKPLIYSGIKAERRSCLQKLNGIHMLMEIKFLYADICADRGYTKALDWN